MGVLSNKIRREQLNPGDHIYTWRCGYFYSHHGIYVDDVDDGKVIHLTRAPDHFIFSLYSFIFSSSHDESSPSHPSGEDLVVCCSLEEFLSDGDLYLYEYGVNRFLYLIQRGGTCTTITSDPPEDVRRRAFILRERGFGSYSLLQNNCEDFAVYCKTESLSGSEYNNPCSSGQIQFLFSLFLVFIFTPSQFLLSGLALLVYGLLLYCGFRLIIINEIVEKVAVEKFYDLRNQRTTIRMENRSTEVSLSERYYITYSYHITYSTLIFNLSTPTSRILVFIYLYYFGLYSFTFDLLRNCPMNLKLEEYVGWIIWALGYWYWRSESRIFFRTKLICLESFLFLLVSNHTRRSKLGDFIAHTTLVLGCCYWTPESTIILWIRLVLFHKFLFYFVYNQLFNNHFKFGRCFFACFVIQSAVLFFGIGLRGLSFWDITEYFSVVGHVSI